MMNKQCERTSIVAWYGPFFASLLDQLYEDMGWGWGAWLSCVTERNMLDDRNTPCFIQTSKLCYSGLAWAPLDSVLSQWIQSVLFHLISLLYISVLSFHLHLVLTNGSFPPGYSSKILYAFFISHVFGSCPTCLILVVVIITRFRTCSKASAVLISLSYRNLFLSGRVAQLSPMTLFLCFPSVTCPLRSTLLTVALNVEAACSSITVVSI